MSFTLLSQLLQLSPVHFSPSFDLYGIYVVDGKIVV